MFRHSANCSRKVKKKPIVFGRIVRLGFAVGSLPHGRY